MSTEIIAYLVCALFLIFVLFVSTDTRTWLDTESKTYLQVIYIAAAITAILAAFLPDNLKSPIVTIAGATLASVGWVITNFQNRRFNRILYTNTQIDHSRNDPELLRSITAVKSRFPKIEPISAETYEVLREEYFSAENYNVEKKEAPTLHYIMHLLNFFERISYLYYNQLVDQRLMYRHFNVLIGTQLVRLQCVVKKIRGGDKNSKAFNDLKKLMDEWYLHDVDGVEELEKATVENHRIKKFYEPQN